MTEATALALQEEESELIFAEGFVDKVKSELTDIKHSFFRIGFLLSEANNLGYYKALGYRNIAELAEEKFGFKQSTTYELMGVYELARDERAPMRIAANYDKFSKSQLTEFCKIKYSAKDFMRIVTPSDTVADIKEAVRIWNKHYGVMRTDVKSLSELIEKWGEGKKPAVQSAICGQLPGQTVIDISEIRNVAEPTAVNDDSEYSENSDAETDGMAATANAPEPMSDDALIIKCLKSDLHIGAVGKFKIYEKFNETPTRQKFVDFIKELYGTGGFGGDGLSVDYSLSKGMTIARADGSKIELPWTYITGRISRLIEANEYLSAEERAAYIGWKAEQDGLLVNVEEPAAPATTISPQNSEYSEKLNFKNDKERKDWLNNFRNWGVWIEVPEVNKTFYRFNFANGAAVIVETGIEYYSYSIKGDKEIEYKSYSIIDGSRPKYDSHGISFTFVIQWLSAHSKEI